MKLNPEALSLFKAKPETWPTALAETVTNYRKISPSMNSDEAYHIVDTWVKLGKRVLTYEQVVRDWGVDENEDDWGDEE